MSDIEQRQTSKSAQRKRAFNVAGQSGYTLGLTGMGIVVAIAFLISNPSVYGSMLNVQSIALSVPEIAILALAISVAMTTAGIDLSIVAVANLSSLFVAVVSSYGATAGWTDFVTTLIAVGGALLIGVACGVFNGFMVATFKITPILTTLATMQVFSGIAIVATKGEAMYGSSNILLTLGTDNLLGIPLVFWLFIVVALVVAFIMARTKFGVKITMLGSNSTASLFSGFSIPNLTIRTYMLTGILSAIAGIVMVSRTGAASASYGDSYLMLAITIAVLGGVNPFGGKRAIGGAAIAALVLQMISSGLNINGASPYIYQIIQGVILAGATVVAFERRRYGQRSIRTKARLTAANRKEAAINA